MRIGGLILAWIWLCAGWVHAAPAVSTFSPTQGEPGTRVRLTGSNLGEITRVDFDNIPADFLLLSPGEVETVVPKNATSGKIRINQSITSTTDFLVTPRIDSFFPTRSAPGNTVILEGANFTGSEEVWFGGKAATFTITAENQIRATVPSQATQAVVRVRNAVGWATSSVPFQVTSPAPVLDSFAPTAGAPGSRVTVEGINFINVQKVEVNGVAAVFTVVAETQLHLDVPASGTSGLIKITTAGGSGTSSQSFQVTRAPVITAFSPTLGKAGMTVVLSGINFSDATGVSFNGKQASFGVSAPGQLSANVPAGASSGVIRVTNQFGVGVSVDSFVVTAAPVITSFSPEAAKPGATVVVEGINFNGVQTVKLNGQTVSFNVPADTQLHLSVPVNATSGLIQLTSSAGSDTSETAFQVLSDAPFIKSFSPPTGPRGTEITLTGENFQNITAVKFNGIAAASFQAVASTQLRVIVPAEASSGPISVTSTGGTGQSATPFLVPPRLQLIEPVQGVVGSLITLKGNNLSEITAVLFNGIPAAFTVQSATVLQATVPDNATSGPVRIESPAGTSISTQRFSVRPQLLSFTPNSGPTGSVVRVTGTSLLQVTNVSIENRSAASTLISNSELTFKVPANAISGVIQIKTAEGAALSTESFTVTSPSDLRLTFTIDPLLTTPGSSAFGTVRAYNAGDSRVTETLGIVNLPSGILVTGLNPQRGTVTVTSNQMRWSIGQLNPGEQVTLTFNGRIMAEGRYPFAASLACLEGELSPGDETKNLVWFVLHPASRKISMATNASGQQILTWPISSVPFAVEKRNSFTSGTWELLGAPVQQVNGKNQVTLPFETGPVFYRLRAE